MAESPDGQDLVRGLEVLMDIGEQLVLKCEKYREINGLGKLLKNCRSELNYLRKLSTGRGKLSAAVLKSSNLSNLQGIALCAEHLPCVVGILKPFHLSILNHALLVDVICNNGGTWVKVITKNSKALIANANEQCNFGTKSITDQARKYLEIAKHHPHQFKVPDVMFVFFHRAPPKMEARLVRLGIKVCRAEEVIPLETLSSELCSNIFADFKLSQKPSACKGSSELELSSHDCESLSSSEYDTESESNDYTSDDEGNSDGEVLESDDFHKFSPACCSLPFQPVEPETETSIDLLGSICTNPSCICKSYIKELSLNKTNLFPHIKRVNLDVTSMIAVVSNLCHSHCDYKFNENYLSLQAKDERSNPTLPGIFGLLLNRSIYSCQTAIDDFNKIVKVVGGVDEKVRAEALVKVIRILPDQISPKSATLHESARINPRMKTIFGTGDSIRAVTCTANNGFIRASKQAGIEFVAFVHSARALTEQKEIRAIKLDTS